MKSDAINELAAALSKAQGEITHATRDSTNPYFNSRYADLASVWEACRGPLSRNGLAIIQSPSFNVGHVTVETTILHSSGQWQSSELTMVPVKSDPQGIGSAITYIRRYSLAAVVGVAPDDDDGNAASGKTGKTGSDVTTEAIPLPPRAVKAERPPDPFAGSPLTTVEVAMKTPEYIGVNQKKAFARAWKEALPEELRDMAEALRGDWMTRNGYVDAAGQPTSVSIMLSEFESVRRKACDFAAGLGETK